MCLRVDVQRAVRSLPEEEQLIVHLMVVLGLTAREAAVRLGLPTMSLHDKYRRALRRLRHRLIVHAPQ